MDKFYINNKAIILRNSDDFSDSKDIELFYEYTTKENFAILVEKMDELDVLHGLCLFNKAYDSMYQDVTGFFKPIEAAGGVIINEKGEFLFIKRNDVWDLPKGKIEKNESPEDAAIREIQEETGVQNLEIIQPLTHSYHAYKHKDNYLLKTNHWFLMRASSSEKLSPQLEEDITEIRWFDKNQIKWAKASTYPSLLDVIEQAVDLA